MSNIRQQLYDRIKASTRDSVILEEMKKLGFWGKNSDIPSLPEQLILKESSLTKELNELIQQQQRYKNKEAALKEIRIARLAKSKAKREENKQLRKKKKEEKAARWKEQKEKDIIYLGDDVSKGLSNKETNVSKLTYNQLPQLQSIEELAKAMNITVGTIRYLAYNRIVSKTSHYKRFFIPKKTGGKRLISASVMKDVTTIHMKGITITIERGNNRKCQGSGTTRRQPCRRPIRPASSIRARCTAVASRPAELTGPAPCAARRGGRSGSPRGWRRTGRTPRRPRTRR